MAINGRIVASLDDMHRLLSRAAAEAVTLTIVRGKRRFEAEVHPHL